MTIIFDWRRGPAVPIHSYANTIVSGLAAGTGIVIIVTMIHEALNLTPKLAGLLNTKADLGAETGLNVKKKLDGTINTRAP